MHFVSCMVRLAGESNMVVARTEFNPVSWPEVEVLRHIHGEDAIVDVKVIAKVDQPAKAEKDRLSVIYGPAVLEDVFPGRNPSMEMEAPGAKISDQYVIWANPILKDPAAYGVQEPKPKAEKPAKTTPASTF